MATTNKIPRDVQEGIRDVMDKKVKVSLKLLVKMETKGDKTENKVLAFTPCRVFVLNAKVPSKLEHSFHFLDIQSIESKKPHQLALTVDGKVYSFQSLEISTEEMDHVITHIGISLKHIFPSFPLERLTVQIDVQPPERLKVMNDLIQSSEKKTVGPCGGYTTMYQCMCDYHGLPFREEVEWDVDTIYLSLDSREFRLQDFDHLMGRDLVSIIGALEHNTWFKALNASNVKLSVEACNELIRVMKRNAVIEEVNLSNTGIRSDFVQKFALALISNSGTQLSNLDISNNLLEDRGILHLLGALKSLPCGLSTFDMSRTGVSTRCLNKVGEVLAQSPNVMASLSVLKLNDNGLKGEDFPLLYNCLAQTNVITYLDVSSTDCALDTLCDPLLRGCASLATLRAAGTVFTHKKNKDVQVPLSWKQLFTSTCCLELVDFSNCRLPPEAVKDMFLGFSANRNLKGVYVDLSSNEFGPSGAKAITPCVALLRGVRGLDLSNNGFDLELTSLLPELAKNHLIKQLSLGRNFANIKPKFRAEAISGLALLLQEENSGLEYLSLADSKLKGETAYVINALGSNETLLEIDISGNAIGDIGARMLAKALMINNRLKKVVWDKNNVSVQGFEDVAEALQKNMTLKKMPYPINDASAALRMYPERTEAALQKIESFLQRNHSPRRFDADQAYRLQQGFLISSTQQIMDRLVVKVEDTVNALQSTSSAESHAQEVESAQKLVADANNSRQLLPSLQDIALKSQAAGNSVDTHLQAMADTLRKAIEQQLEKTTEEMLKCTSDHCPAVMSNETFHGTILEGCQTKSSLPKDFTTGVLETAGTDIYNTTSEMNLAVAALISDSVIDGVIESLSSAHKSLTTHLNIRKSGLFKEKEEKEDDPMARLRVPPERFYMPSLDYSLPPSSPKLASKRKSVLNRKTRPQSTMGDDSVIHNPPRAPAAENHVIGKIKENSAASTPSGSSEQLSELPDLPDLPDLTTAHKPLEHVTKARPRRAKAHRPTRPVVSTGTTEMEDGPDNGLSSQALSASIAPPTSSSPKAPDRKDHKAKKDESPSSSKSKEDGSSKKWMPSFMKKKEDKSSEKEQKEAKKSNSFSSSFTGLFKKRGSEDKKRPSLVPEVPQSESKPDTAEVRASSSHVENGKKAADTSLEAVKEVQSIAESSPKVTITAEDQQAEEQKSPSPNRSPGPVAPRRMLSHERAAMLPPNARVSGGKKSPELRKSADPKKVPVAAEEDTNLSTQDQRKDAAEKGSPKSQKKEEDEEREESTEKEESKAEAPKLPPGVAKMPGLGALGGKNLMQEMRLKQNKRFSQKPLSPGEEHKEMPAVAKPSAETNNNTQDSKQAAPSTPSPTTLAPERPSKAPRPSSRGEASGGGSTPSTPEPSTSTKQSVPAKAALATLSPTTHEDSPAQQDVTGKPSDAAETPEPSPAKEPALPKPTVPSPAPTSPEPSPSKQAPPLKPTVPNPTPTSHEPSPSRRPPPVIDAPAPTSPEPSMAKQPLVQKPVAPTSPEPSVAKPSLVQKSVSPTSPEPSMAKPSLVEKSVAPTSPEPSISKQPLPEKPVGPATPEPSPSKLPPKPKPAVPKAAPRVVTASKRPVSVAESPGLATAEVPSSMTTSTPEFHLDETASGSSGPKPTPPTKTARPPIMPRPRKRDSAPPTEESSDIPPPPIATPTTPSAADTVNPTSMNQAASPSSAPTTTTTSAAVSAPSPPATDTTGSSSNSSKPNAPKPLSKPVAGSDHDQGVGAHSSSSKSTSLSQQPPSSTTATEQQKQQQHPAPCEAASVPGTEAASEEGIVYDSATLRMSVKDKIKRLKATTEAANAPPKASSATPLVAKTKAMSLPKDARLPDGEALSDATRPQSTQDSGPVAAAIPEEDVAEPEQGEEDPVDSKPAASVPDDEIMV